MQRLGSISLTAAAAAGIITGGVIAASHSSATSSAPMHHVVAAAKPAPVDPQLATLRHEAQVLAAQIAAARGAQNRVVTSSAPSASVTTVSAGSARTVTYRPTPAHVRPANAEGTTTTTEPPSTTPSTTWVDDNGTEGGTSAATSDDGAGATTETETATTTGTESEAGGRDGTVDHARKAGTTHVASHARGGHAHG